MSCINQVTTDRYTAIHGDCVEALSDLPDACVGYSIFSPPFASLYTYSNSPRDMGNCRTDAEFFEHFDFLIAQLRRVMKPGRDVSFHCMDMPASKERDGYIGLKDFGGDLLRAFQRHGFIFHSKVTIWKDPVPVANPDTTHANPSGKPIREEGIREEKPSQALPKNKGGSDAASPAPRSPSKAARLPLDWVLPKAMGDWALQERPDWTAEHVRKVAEQFRDHWHAQGGANARKVDWAAAWRTWVRREPAGRVAGAGASAAPAAGWYETPEGVSAKGASLGIQQREGENRHVYRWRVLKAAAEPVAIEKEVAAAARMNIAEHERAHQFFYGCLPGQMSRAA